MHIDPSKVLAIEIISAFIALPFESGSQPFSYGLWASDDKPLGRALQNQSP